MKRKLKILQCLVFYLPNRIGGIEVYVHSLNLVLRDKGHDVKVLVPDFPGETAYPAEVEGIPVISYPEYNNTNRDEFQGNVAGKSLPGFLAALKKEQPDVVHFHQFTSSNGISLFHLQAARDLGIKIIYTNHLAGFTCQTGKLVYRDRELCDGIIRPVRCAVCDLKRYNWNEPASWMVVQTGRLLSGIIKNKKDTKLGQLLYYSQRIQEKRKRVQGVLDLADRFIVLTDWYYEVLVRNGFNMANVKIVRQALPLYDHGIIASRPARMKGAGIRIVFIGRVVPEKGLYILLKALAGIDEMMYSLDIYGQVDDQDYFKQCAAIYERKTNIKYHGFINSRQIVNVLKEHDVLILPSVIAEMAPLVIQEAFAAGIPVVGTRIGGIAEEIQPGKNGFLFEMGNVSQLHVILALLVNDPSLLTKMSSEIKMPAPFEVVADQMEQEYLSVV